MGKAIRACALVLLFACSAQAGWMTNDRIPPPPDEQQQMTSSDAADETDGDTQDVAADALTRTVLDLLAGVLTLI